MRRIFLLIFALIVVLVACTGLLLYRPSVWPAAAARIGASPFGSPPADRESPFAMPEPKPTVTIVPTPVPPSDAAQWAKPVSPENAVSASVEYRFPTRTDIRVGTSKPEILASFGPPQATVTGADRGQLQERMIYTERSTGKKTLIAVVNGKVTSAETYVAEKAQE